MSRSFNFSIGEFYHLYGRGTDKRKIFLVKKDYQRFIALLYISNSKKKIHLSDHQNRTLQEILKIPREETLVDIGAYCLMGNHFHLLVKEKEKGGTSLFMQKVMTGYTMYFNKKYSRTGSLFESRFKAQHVTTDNHLKYLFSYIHLNPVKIIDPEWKEKGIKDKKETLKFIENYPYTSFLNYVSDHRIEDGIVSPAFFPLYFEITGSYQKEIFDWLYVKVEP